MQTWPYRFVIWKAGENLQELEFNRQSIAHLCGHLLHIRWSFPDLESVGKNQFERKTFRNPPSFIHPHSRILILRFLSTI
jgi:hypothetical protein